MKKFYTLVAMIVALTGLNFSAQAQTEEGEMVEIYKSDMTDWTFRRLSGIENWQVISTGDSYLDRMTASEKSKTGCDDGIGIVYDDDNDTNAWAISPAINLSADTKYTVQVYMKAASYGDPENFKVSVATESSASALNSAAPLISQNGFSTNSFVAFSTAYTPAETGDYYFGVNCCSESMNYGLYATGFTISYMQTSGVVVTVADENGAIEYFDLQGRPVSNPTPGLYICRQGDKVTKVVVR